MKDRIIRSITIAVVAAYSIGIAANAQTTTSDDKVISDETTTKTTMTKQIGGTKTISTIKCGPKKVRKISYHRCGKNRISYRATKLVALAPTSYTKETRIEHTKVLERPAVIQQEVTTVAEPAEPVVITQPVVLEQQTPVVIDRYVKRHRSLLHLGLFPFNLFGQ